MPTHPGDGPRYIGGPLDGQPAEHRCGKWSIYRRDDGSPLSPSTGDSIFCGAHSWAPRLARMTRHYIHQGFGVYLHGTVERGRRITDTLNREHGFGAYNSQKEYLADLVKHGVPLPTEGTTS